MEIDEKARLRIAELEAELATTKRRLHERNLDVIGLQAEIMRLAQCDERDNVEIEFRPDFYTY